MPARLSEIVIHTPDREMGEALQDLAVKRTMAKLGLHPKPGRPLDAPAWAARIREEYLRQREATPRPTQASVAEALHISPRHLQRQWRPRFWPPT